MTRPSIQINENLAEPYFCEDKEDFYKLCLAEGKAHSRDVEEMSMFMLGLRIMFHEYLALVLSQKIEPYEEDEEWIEKEKEGFKGTMDLVNEFYAEVGVPIYEDENGKIKIDYDEMNKKIEEMHGHGHKPKRK